MSFRCNFSQWPISTHAPTTTADPPSIAHVHHHPGTPHPAPGTLHHHGHSNNNPPPATHHSASSILHHHSASSATALAAPRTVHNACARPCARRPGCGARRNTSSGQALVGRPSTRAAAMTRGCPMGGGRTGRLQPSRLKLRASVLDTCGCTRICEPVHGLCMALSVWHECVRI